VSANVGGIGSGPADINPHIATDDPAQLLQRLMEHRQADLKFYIVGSCGQDYADPPNALALLPSRHHRPSSRSATENNKKIPPSHVRP
jgi:hypothetical protein